MVKKLVISYSNNDKAVADRLRQTLINEGHEVWIASEDLRSSVIWTQTILDAIDNADGVVLVWSSSTSKSKDALEEVRIARVFLKPIFPILAYPDEQYPPLPNEIRSLQIIQDYNFDSTTTELVERLLDPERSNIDYSDIDVKGHIRKLRNPYFVGRKKELKELFVDCLGFHGETKKGIPIAIAGLAGIGKTELALTFAYRFSLFFSDGVYWIDTPNGIVQEFEKVGVHLGIEKLQEERPLNYAGRVYDKLCQLERGLVVFDNVLDIKEFREWCPVGNRSCAVILTTRKSPRGFPVRVMNLVELDSGSAYELIISRRKNRDNTSEDDAQKLALREICDLMGNYPLALELCASYLQSVVVKPTDLLQDLQDEPLEHLANHPEFREFLNEGEANLLEILSRNYDSLNRKLVDPYFLLLCCFAPRGINVNLIVNAYGDSREGGKALTMLDSHSMIYIESQNLIYLHPLVAQFGKFLQKTISDDYHNKFVDVITGFLQENIDSLPGEAVKKELPHIFEAIKVALEYQLWIDAVQLHEYCAEIVDGVDTEIEMLEKACEIIDKRDLYDQKRKLPDLHVRLGKARRKKGQPTQALDEFDEAGTLYSELSEVDPAEVAMFQFELGDVLVALGRYKEAGKILTRALNTALKEASFDESAPVVNQIKQSQARRELILGNYKVAESKLEEILQHRLSFHASFPSQKSIKGVITSYADLSWLDLEQGDYNHAIQKAQEAQNWIEEFYQDKNDPIYGDLSFLLGRIHFSSGEYNQAKGYLDTAKQIFSKAYGEKHSSYARALTAQGEVYRKLGEFEQAQEEISLALEILRGPYDDDFHPLIADTLEVQGKIYNHLCMFTQEQDVWNQVLEIQTKIYSENHYTVATTHYNYANLFLEQSDFDQALFHLNRSIILTERIFGKNHSEYFGRLIRLADCYYEQLQYKVAQEKLKEADGLKDKIFVDSPHTYVARMYQLQSEVNRRLGRYVDAEDSIEQAIKMKEKIYGKDHPSVAEALQVKVRVLHRLGKIKESKSLIDQALNIRKEYYGEKHPAIGNSEHDLGSYHLRLGEYKEAIDQFEKARSITKAVYGTREHPEYIERSINLADALYEQGEYEKCLVEVNTIGDLVKAFFGEKVHYLRARWLYRAARVYRRKGRFEDALDFASRSHKVLKNLFGEIHPDVAEILEVTGKVYRHQGKYEKSAEIWDQILDIQAQVFPPNHPNVATTHYNYATVKLEQSDFDQALVHLTKSIDITEKSLGKTHANYFECLIRLALCYYEQLQYKVAQEKLKEAEGLKEATFGDSPHPYVARMYQLQSEVNRRLGRYVDAEDSIEQAIKMKEKIYGKDHPSVAEALQVKVRVLHRLGKIKESKSLIDQALNIRKEYYGEKHPAIGNSEHDLGSYHLRLGEYKEAIDQFEKARSITKAVYGTREHPEYIERSINLADALYEQGEYEKCLVEVNTIGDLVKAFFGEKVHYLRARWLYRAARVYRRKGRFEDALDFASRSHKVLKNLFGEIHPDVAEILEVTGKVYRHQGKYEKSAEIWDQILDIQAQVFPPNHPNVATTHYNYATVKLEQSDFDQALVHLTKSIDITEKSLGKTHANYFECLIRLALCYYEQLQYKVAQEKLKEAEGLKEATFGDSPHTYVARMYQLQSEVNRRLGRYVDAEDSIEQAIKMKEKIYGKDHPSVAEALEVKVKLNLDQLLAKESVKVLDRIERIRKKNYGENHLEYANYQLRLVEYYSITREYDTAHKVLKRSLQICLEKFSSAHHPEIIKRRITSARLFRMSGDIYKAEESIEEVLNVLGKRVEAENSYVVVSVLKEAASINRKNSDYKTSLEQIERALEIEKKILGDGSPSVIELLINKVKILIVSHQFAEASESIRDAKKHTSIDQPIYKIFTADLLEQQGILESSKHNLERAIEKLDEAIALKEEVLGKKSVQIAKSYINKAEVLRQLGRYSDAFEYLEKAQNINNPHFSENHVYFARIFLESGRVYHHKRSFLAAKEQLEEARSIYKAQPGHERRESANASESLGLVYLETGYLSEAHELFKEALEIKMDIYDPQHPAIAETVNNEAQVVLRMVASKEKGLEDLRKNSLKKLKTALKYLNKNGQNGVVLKEKIKQTLSQLEELH